MLSETGYLGTAWIDVFVCEQLTPAVKDPLFGFNAVFYLCSFIERNSQRQMALDASRRVVDLQT